MITEKLAQEKEAVANSYEECHEKLHSEFKVEHFHADLNQIRLTEDGILGFPGGEYPISDWAFESLCGLIDMSPKFAKGIRDELMLVNIDTLKHDRNAPVDICVSRGLVVNVFERKPYEALRNIETLAGIQKAAASLGANLNNILISDRGMHVSLLYPGRTLEPLPGDITETGINILTSETGFRGTKASFYMFRLICSNGAIVGNRWGDATWSYDGRISRERSIANFFDKVLAMDMDFNGFADRYAGLPHRRLKVRELVNYHRRLARIVGNEPASAIANISDEDRNRMRLEMRFGNPDAETEIAAYDLYNAITAMAREVAFYQRRQLESLGGGLIDI